MELVDGDTFRMAPHADDDKTQTVQRFDDGRPQMELATESGSLRCNLIGACSPVRALASTTECGARGSLDAKPQQELHTEPERAA